MEAKENGFRAAVLVAIRYAHFLGMKRGEKVGVIVMIAGIAKVLGAEKAVPLFEAVGIRRSRAFIDGIPKSREAGSERLSVLRPNSQLKALLNGRLAGLLKNEMKLESALENLLGEKDVVEEIQVAFDGSTKKGGEKPNGPAHFDTLLFVRNLTKIYHSWYFWGRRHVGETSDSGVPDFISGEGGDLFGNSSPDLLENQKKIWRETLGSEAYICSPLGSIRERFGQGCADIIAVLLLNEMGFIGKGLLSLRELVFTLEPKNYHRAANQVRSHVEQLVSANLARWLFLDGGVRLFSRVMVAQDLIEEFLTFLDLYSEFSEQEDEDTVRQLISEVSAFRPGD